MNVFGIVGGCAERSELVARLVAELLATGLRVSTIKRVPDTVDLEKPGSGSLRHRQAGATEVMLASSSRFALLRETPVQDEEPDVDALLARLEPVDIVLLEGFRLTLYPKLEVLRPHRDRRPLVLDDPSVVAVTASVPVSMGVPFVTMSDTRELVRIVLQHATSAATALS